MEEYSINPIKRYKDLKKRTKNTNFIFFKNINYNLDDFFDYIDVVSFNSSVRMKNYVKTLPDKIVFQGNLDPIKLLVGGSKMEEAVLNIMKDMKQKNFIFNLGHGILPKHQ